MNFSNIPNMKQMIFRIAVLLILSVLVKNPISAQWWNNYGPGSFGETIETANGDLVALGTTQTLPSGPGNGLVIRTDANGNELWRLTFPNNPFYSPYGRVFETDEGDILVGLSLVISPNTDQQTIIYKLTSDGNIVWENPLEESSLLSLENLSEHPVSGKILATFDDKYNNVNTSEDTLLVRLIQLDETGSIELVKNLLHNDSNNPSLVGGPKIISIADGYIMAFKDSLFRLNNSLSKIWSNEIPGEDVYDLVETDQGDFIGISFLRDSGNSTAHIYRFNENGTINWTNSFLSPWPHFMKITKRSNGEYRIIYKRLQWFSSPTTETASRTMNSTGIVGPIDTISTSLKELFSIIQTNSQDLIFSGSIYPFPTNSRTGFLLRTNSELSNFNNVLTGRVFVDENFDCTYDSTEQLLPQYPIQLIHENGFVYYGTSDNNGLYTIEVFNGRYQTTAIPQSMYENPCTPEIIDFDIVDTTVNANLPIQQFIECPQMTVSIGTPFIRRCFENTYAVQYCNYGTIEAEDAYVEIMLDSFTIYENSSIPPTSQTGSLLVFDLGDIPSRECNNFTITTTLSCDAELGQTHCITAHIYPDSICLANSPEWDGSSIQVSAQCTEDSVRFFINNLGTGDMLAPLDYIVIQDEILFFQDDFQLNSGSSLIRSFPADGSTYRLEANQAVGHPGNSMPSATVEGCGEWPFATGFFGFFPQNDNDPFIDIDCLDNIGSYDPNDKSAFPIGFGEEKIIEPGTMMEYKIRFQNTGTDTAFNVSIRDTLSSILNPATLTMGAASHPYSWRLEGQGVLVVDFPNILLPDSTTNFAASNGFVSFKIDMVPEISLPHFWLENNAAIYFDFNEPIITNTVSHSIDTQFVEILVSVETIPEQNSLVKVAPNPADDQVNFTFPEDSEFPLTLKLYDTQGRLIRTEKVDNLTKKLEVSYLARGIFYYGIYDNEGLWSSGKLLLQ